MNLCFVYITNPTKDEAKSVAKHLLKKNLIACANIYNDVDSLYYWEGKLADEKEFILIGKTTEDKYEAIKEEVDKIHSYTTPCIIKIPIQANEKYAGWLLSELKNH